MTDIVIYTTLETLKHKSNPKLSYFWTMKRFPKKFIEEEISERIEGIYSEPAKVPVDNFGRIFFAVKGFVVGSFEIIEVNPGEEETIVWNGDSWEELKEKIPTKHFQGFKYKWWK